MVGRLGLTAVISVLCNGGEPGADFSHTGSTLCSPCQHFIHPRKHKEQAGGHGLRWEERLGACSGAGEVRLGKGV